MCGAGSAVDALFCKLLQRSHPGGMAEVGCSKPASFMQVSTHKAPEDDLAQEMTHDPHGAAARAADWHNPDAISPGGTPARLSPPTPMSLCSSDEEVDNDNDKGWDDRKGKYKGTNCTVTGGGEGGGGYAGGKGKGSHCGCTSADHGGTNGNAPAEVPCRQRITGKGSSKGKGKIF